MGEYHRIVVMDVEGDVREEMGRIPVIALDFTLSPSGRFICTFEKLQGIPLDITFFIIFTKVKMEVKFITI